MAWVGIPMQEDLRLDAEEPNPGKARSKESVPDTKVEGAPPSEGGSDPGKRQACDDGFQVQDGQVIVSAFGAFLGKKSERLVVKRGKDVVGQLPFHDVHSILVTGAGVSISSDAIQECMEHGIQIDFLTLSGKPYAKLISPALSATVVTRREQLLAYSEKRGLKLAKAFVDGKLRNQQGLLHYFARYRRAEDSEMFDELSKMEAQILAVASELSSIDGSCVDDVREQLLSVEGRAGAIYWRGVQRLVSDKIEFRGREHREAEDPFNALLNYGYGILYSTVWGAIVLAGLEPFAGFIHTDRPGKPSLCLDLTEEFRQRVVDRTVVSFVTRGASVLLKDGRLDERTRLKLVDHIQQRLASRETYQGREYKLRTIIQLQARRLASFLRGEVDYRPYVGRW